MQQIDDTPNYALETVEIDKALLPQQAQVIKPEKEAPVVSTVATIDIPTSRLTGRKFREKLKLNLHYYGSRYRDHAVLSTVRYPAEYYEHNGIIASFRSDADFVIRQLPVVYLLQTTAQELYVVVRMPDSSFRLGRKLSTDDEPVSVLTASELRNVTKLRIMNRNRPRVRDHIDAELNRYRTAIA